MKRLILCVLALLIVGSSAAFADTYNLTFTGTAYGGTSNIYIDGVQHGTSAYYIGPYLMKVSDVQSGINQTLPLVCLAGATNLVGGTWTISDQTINQQAAFIAYEMIVGIGTLSSTELAGMQFAVWQLMDPGKIYTSNYSTVNDFKVAWLDITQHPIQNVGYKLYWPEHPPEGQNQPFEGVPEPSLAILLGLGILAGVGSTSIVKKR